MSVTNVDVHHQCSALFKLEILVLHSVFQVVVSCNVVEVICAEGRHCFIKYDVNGDSVQIHICFKLDCAVPSVICVFAVIVSEN